MSVTSVKVQCGPKSADDRDVAAGENVPTLTPDAALSMAALLRHMADELEQAARDAQPGSE